jgi:putative RNA 2'-phosphotransferase
MVGRRHGKPIVLTIQAGRMYEFGFQFFCSTNGVWLTEKVPAEHLLFPEE